MAAEERKVSYSYDAADLSQPVFISHSLVDARYADVFARELGLFGIRSWFAARDADPHRPYWEQIDQVIAGAGAMVVIMSPALAHAPNVYAELERARRAGYGKVEGDRRSGRPIVGVALDPPSADHGLGDISWVAAWGGDDGHCSGLAVFMIADVYNVPCQVEQLVERSRLGLLYPGEGKEPRYRLPHGQVPAYPPPPEAAGAAASAPAPPPLPAAPPHAPAAQPFPGSPPQQYSPPPQPYPAPPPPPPPPPPQSQPQPQPQGWAGAPPPTAGRTGLIIGVSVAVALLVIVVAVVLLARPGSRGSTTSYEAPATSSPSSSSEPALSNSTSLRPVTIPTNGLYLVGTWGPSCPQSAAQSITLHQDGTFNAPAGTGTWTIDTGSTVTMTGNGRTEIVDWSMQSANEAVLYRTGGGTARVRRC